MKKTLTLVFVGTFFMGLASYALAQETQDVNSSATIKGAITLTKNADLSFGNLTSPGSSTTVTVDPNGTNSNVEGSGATTGEIEITSDNSIDLSVAWDKTITTLSDGTNTMNLTFDVDGDNDGTASGAADLTNSSGEQVTTSATGKYYIYLGGALTVGASQPSGYYTSDSGTASAGGDVTFTVDFY